MSAPPVSASQMAAHLNMTNEQAGSNGPELDLVLEAATDVVENHVGPIVQRTVTEYVHAAGGALLLPSWPVVSVTSIADVDEVAVDITDLYETGGRLSVYGSPFPLGRYLVTYEAGWATPPAALKLAVLIVAAHLWMTQRPAGGMVPGRFGAEQFDTVGVPRGFAVPARALQLMEPFMQPGVA